MKRIAIAAIYHETNTFAHEHNDTLAADVKLGQEVIDKNPPKHFISGFIEAASREDIEFVPTVDVRFPRGGLIHADVYDHYVGMIVDAIREAGKLDGVYFALHGAMAAEDPYTDAEGELLKRVRAVVGEGVPFVATYDFHSITSHDECAQLSGAFPHNTNPHVDAYEQGLEAGACMLRTLDGEIKPVTRVVHIPIIGPNIGQSTWSPLADDEERLPLYQLSLVREGLERTPGVINIAIQGGYGYADTPESCMSVVVTTDNDPDLAVRLARQMAEEVWQKREQIVNVRPIVSIDEGVRTAMECPESPVVLVDLGDDPGSSCTADSPAVLESLIRQGAKDCVLTIRDPNVVEAALKAGIGATLEMEVGAAIDQRFYQPITIKGVVKSLDDGNYMICGPFHGGWGKEVRRESWREANLGPRAVVRIGDKIDVIFSISRRTGKDRDFFKSAGIVFDEKKIIVVKSNQAHRASFDSFVERTIDLASPGASTVDYASLTYKHIQRPLWPIDRDFEWSAYTAD
ncbi:MAG TPA: M81 family metallopeptidase [Thermomicrobiales bacterium]|nr:M81 family metallopeptidase [Thermomicrobiales bacterium]